MISSRYYLNKEGLDLELISRRAKNPLTADQKAVVDQCYAEVQDWKQNYRYSKPSINQWKGLSCCEKALF